MRNYRATGILSGNTSGFDFEYIHTRPVIRGEDVFSRLSIDERRKLLFKMLTQLSQHKSLNIA